MKSKYLFIRSLILIVFNSVLIIPLVGSPGKIYYISPGGNDENPGSKKKPFLSLERAREEIRKIKEKENLPEGGITVYFSEGVYRINSTFELTDLESGTPESPVIFCAEKGHKVRLMGGNFIREWSPVKDISIYERLNKSVRDNIVQADLQKAGVKNTGLIRSTKEKLRADLICNGEYLQLSRFPNAGEWLRIKDVPQHGDEKITVESITHYGKFTYDEDRPAAWKDKSEIWMHGYWVHDWSDEYEKVNRFDTEKHEVYPEKPYHHYGYKKDQRYYFLNIPEEIDQKGEWYLDRKNFILYLLPPAEIIKSEIIFPELEQPMIVLNNTHDIKIEGISFESSREGGIIIRAGERNEIRGCTFKNLGNTAVSIDGGINNGITSCNLLQLAGSGITITGGDRETLTPAGNYVDNCEIHHYARINKTYNPAISIRGVGNRVSHCFIHDAPHQGIQYHGNDHVIEYCEFTKVAQETGDVGCIYSLMDWTYLGNVIRYNYFHNIHGPGLYGCNVIYPDLPVGGIHLYGNIIDDVDWVFHTNSGRGMVIENNIFLNSNGFHWQIWHEPGKFMEGGNWRMVERLKAVNYDKPPYSTRYPVLQNLEKDFRDTSNNLLERRRPKDNIIRNNISWGNEFLLFNGPVNLNDILVENNVIADKVVMKETGRLTGEKLTQEENLKELEKRGNLITEGNPGFVNVPGKDFRIIKGSVASKIDFKPIPLELIGIQKDKYRKLYLEEND